MIKIKQIMIILATLVLNTALVVAICLVQSGTNMYTGRTVDIGNGLVVTSSCSGNLLSFPYCVGGNVEMGYIQTQCTTEGGIGVAIPRHDIWWYIATYPDDVSETELVGMIKYWFEH